jgi:hypothetical protein
MSAEGSGVCVVVESMVEEACVVEVVVEAVGV